jgi:hypothetical protein
MIETLVRNSLKAAGVWLIHQGWTTDAALESALPGLTLFVAGMLWSLWEQRNALRKVNTALAMPEGSSQAQLIETIKRDGAVPASLAATVHPIHPADFAIKQAAARDSDG